MTSISAQMMSSISEFRNANGTEWHQHTGLERILTRKRAKILAAEAGYMFTFAVAVVETAARSTLLLLSTLVTPISTDPMVFLLFYQRHSRVAKFGKDKR